MTTLRTWKKVLETDLDNIIVELKDAIEAPAVIILTGEVGTGKTTLTQRFAPKGLGQVMSPTYSIVNEVGDICHADFYRLKSKDDVEHLELELYLDDKKYFLVEWGRPYLSTLQRELAREFTFYELKITANEASEDEKICASRNYFLEKLD